MNIFVIIVLYNPTEEDLQHTKHVAEIEAGFIIDNSEKASLPNKIGKMNYICNKKEFGHCGGTKIWHYKRLSQKIPNRMLCFSTKIQGLFQPMQKILLPNTSK